MMRNINKSIIGNKLLFIHIPKTGGSSFKKYYKGGDILYHWRLKDIRDEMPEYLKYGRISVIRNPFDRLYSAWKHIMQPNAMNRRKGYDTEIISFEEFVMNDVYKRSLFTYPQWDYLELDGELQSEIIRFESLSDGIHKLDKKLGLKSKPIPHLRKSKQSKHYSTYYTDEMKTRVEEYYRDDLNHFNYRFETKCKCDSCKCNKANTTP